MVGGKLVAMSVDVYISMEFGAEGDLFNLRRACCQQLPNGSCTELPGCSKQQPAVPIFIF